MRIRLATLCDAEGIALLLYNSFLEFRAQYTEKGFAATTPGREQIAIRLTEGPIWVALQSHQAGDDELVGTVAVVLSDKELYVRGMAVLPTARGHRIGESLLETVESCAVAPNVQRLFLSTTPFLHRAIRLYERRGFRRTDEGPHDIFGTPLFTMEKRMANTGRC